MPLDEEAALEHYGVKGMKWGVRREAKRDANKFAKAKMYYGEGAGTQRKLIKATVESKRKKDSQYGEAFDYYMDNQNMATRAQQARTKRRTTDATNSVRKTARGIGHIINGNSMYASAAAVAIYGAAKFTGADKVVVKAAKTAYNTVAKKVATEYNVMKIKQQFKNFV